MSFSRPRSSSIYKDPPRTRQRTLILAAFLPWGGSDDTVTRRTGPQHTRFRPTRAAATRHGTSPQACPTENLRQHRWAASWPGQASRRRAEPHVEQAPPVRGCRRDLPRCWWAVAGPGRASSRRAERSSQRGRLAGGPPPTGTHSGRARRPEHERRPKQQKPRNLKRSRGPVAEDGGFEPPRACTQHAFQACAIGH